MSDRHWLTLCRRNFSTFCETIHWCRVTCFLYCCSCRVAIWWTAKMTCSSEISVLKMKISRGLKLLRGEDVSTRIYSVFRAQPRNCLAATKWSLVVSPWTLRSFQKKNILPSSPGIVFRDLCVCWELRPWSLNSLIDFEDWRKTGKGRTRSIRRGAGIPGGVPLEIVAFPSRHWIYFSIRIGWSVPVVD